MAEDMNAALELMREAYGAFNRGDFDAAVAALHPEVEWNRVAEVESALHGREAVREFMQPDVFESQRTEIEEITTHGDKILVHAAFSVIARGSRLELTQDSYQLWTIRDGLGAKLEVFFDRDEALRAAAAS